MVCLCSILTKAVFVYLCICIWVTSEWWWMSTDSGRHKLSENIWFVWSEMSYSGDMEGCHACVQTTDSGRNVKIELEFWKQNSQ